MERALRTSIVAVAALVSLAAVFITGDACDQIPTMSWNDACLQSCNFSQDWIKLCQDTLSSNAPPTAEVDIYALAAARQARIRYAATIDLLNQMLGVGTLPKDEKLSVSLCKRKYLAADGLFGSIIDQLAVCDLADVRQEFLDAQVSISSCRDGLWPYQNLQVYGMVSGDFDMTMVAYELAALFVGK